MGWIAGAASSGTALAEYAETDPTKPNLVLKGIHWNIRGGGTTASLIELHSGDSSNNFSTMVLSASTGGAETLWEPKGFAKGRYIAVDATSHMATSNSVLIWGDYE